MKRLWAIAGAPCAALCGTCAAIALAASLPVITTAEGRPAVQATAEAADRAVPRTDRNSALAHAQLLEKAKHGGIDLYVVGDSIARRWGATDYPDLLVNWRQNFFGWNAADFGWGADKTQHILWRLENGELDDVNPKVIVILAGTNNVGSQPGGAGKVAEITRGLTAIVNACRQRAPAATIVVTAIFPRNDLFDGMMNERDKLHPTIKGYQVWADGLKPILTELLGPPAATDHAPPPTGDPSAAGRAGPPK